MPAGRPVKYTSKIISLIKEDFKEYLKTAEFPTQYQFWYTIVEPKYGMSRCTFYELEELSDTRKNCNDAQKEALMRLGSFNVVNPTMAIFLLKNLGMSDKQDIAITTPEGIKVHWE